VSESIEKQIQDYLDSVYVISHSKASVHNYKYGIDQLAKFTQEKYEKPLETVITQIKDGSIDV